MKQYNISFPSNEIKQLKRRLGSGKPIYTTRISKDVGKYRKNMTVNNKELGQLKIKKVLSLKDINKHPFYNDLTKKQLKLISGKKYQVIELRANKLK